MAGGRTDAFSERLLENLGKLTAPPGKRLISVAERGRRVDGLSLAPVRLRHQPEPRPVSFLSQELCDVLQPPSQREAFIGPRLPTPFLVSEPFHPLPEPLPDMVEQIEDIVTRGLHGTQLAPCAPRPADSYLHAPETQRT